MPEFLGDEQRDYESDDNHEERLEIFENFPKIEDQEKFVDDLTNRPLPKFAQLISSGCSLRKLIPTIDPGEAFSNDDLYYPEGEVELVFEVGSHDDVPSECAVYEYEDLDTAEVETTAGARENQAREYEVNTGIEEDNSRYRVVISEGPHDLLGEDDIADEIHLRLLGLIESHF